MQGQDDDKKVGFWGWMTIFGAAALISGTIGFAVIGCISVIKCLVGGE